MDETSMGTPSCQADASTNVTHSPLGGITPLVTPCTEPSAKANCTTPLCRLLKCHQPVSAAVTGRPQAVGKAPLPIHECENCRGPNGESPSVSPKRSVLLAPSAPLTCAMLRLERFEKQPV